MVQFRKSKSFGPVRLTASKRGLGISAGAGPIRVSRGADGRVRRTVRVPGTGVYDTKVIAGGKRKPTTRASAAAGPTAPPTTTAEQGKGLLGLTVLVVVIVLMFVMGRWFFILAGVGLVALTGFYVVRNQMRARAKKAVAAARVPAGWLPDPKGYDQLRYWDGDKWTPHVHPNL